MGLAYFRTKDGLMEGVDHLSSQINKAIGDSNAPHWFVAFYKDQILPVFPVLLSAVIPLMLCITLYVGHISFGQVTLRLRLLQAARARAKGIAQSIDETVRLEASRQAIIRQEMRAIEALERVNKPDLIHTEAKYWIGRLENLVVWRKAHPFDAEMATSFVEFQDIPLHWFERPIPEVEELIRKLQEQATIENITRALKEA